MHDPMEDHREAVYQSLRYLKKGGGDLTIEAYIDVDWARSITNIRSTSRWCHSYERRA